MKFYHSCPQVALIATLLIPWSLKAGSVTVFTDLNSFQNALELGAYSESFTNNLAGPFSNGTYGFNVSASGGTTYHENGLIGGEQESDTVTLLFTSLNVTAVGGNFFHTDVFDVFQSSPVNLNLSDGTLITFTPLSFADSFRGFVTTDGTLISSLSFPNTEPSQYSTIDNIIVGKSSVVPEPSSFGFTIGAIATLWQIVRRSKSKHPQRKVRGISPSA